MNKQKQTNEGKVNRRGFFTKLWMLFSGAAILEGGWIAANFLRPRVSSQGASDDGDILIVGPVSRFEKGSVTAFQEGKFYLVCLPNGGFMALSRKCTHLGCTVPWSNEKQQFECPCHASVFNIKGEVLSPPAPRPLDRYHVRIENNIVKVNIASILKRDQFSTDQVVIP